MTVFGFAENKTLQNITGWGRLRKVQKVLHFFQLNEEVIILISEWGNNVLQYHFAIFTLPANILFFHSDSLENEPFDTTD